MLLEFIFFVLAVALRAAPLICRDLWALGVQSWSATCSGGLFGLLCRPLRAAKTAAQSSRPSWVVAVMPSDSGSIVGPARLPRGSPCSDGSTYAVCTLRGHALGTVLGSEWHGCCALVSPRCPWDGGGALIGSLQNAGCSVGRWRPASSTDGDGFIARVADDSAW